MRRGWWPWLVWAMSGGRCQLQREDTTTGMGVEGGLGAGEPSCPGSRASQVPEEASTSKLELGIDFFSQARKALSERSPFDIPEDGSAPSTTVSTLPRDLAALLKHSESRKRNKSSHGGRDNNKKKSAKPGERSRGRDIWNETEDYFRDLTLPDIETLSNVASGCSLASVKFLLLQRSDSNTNNKDNAEVPECSNGDAAVHQEGKEGMELDNVAEEQGCSVSGSCSNLEWLLGCRDKIYLTTERPSKKRKLLGSDAGLEKVFIARPCEGDSTMCDFCCKGASGTDANRLVVCSSCKVSVHRKCYGVTNEVDGSWLCSWCTKKDSRTVSDYSCILCPRQGGALKPVHIGGSASGSIEFAHLFCSQWMPEVYVEDLTRMEPILNVEKIAEARRKLVCNVCKIKCGVGLRCSHGTCRAAFHPMCAREGRQRMEIWGKSGDDNVELRAFCSKHSEVQSGNVLLQSGRTSQTVGVDSYMGNSSPEGSELEDSLNDTKSTSEQYVDKAKSNLGEEAKKSDSYNLLLVLKKLIDGGKVNVKDVASDIGFSPDLLVAELAGDVLAPDLRCRLIKWLKDHAHLGIVERDSRLHMRRGAPTKAHDGVTNDSDSVTVSGSDVSHPVAVKSVPPRRRTKSDIRILKDRSVLCSSDTSAEGNLTRVVLDKEDESPESCMPTFHDKASGLISFTF